MMASPGRGPSLISVSSHFHHDRVLGPTGDACKLGGSVNQHGFSGRWCSLEAAPWGKEDMSPKGEGKVLEGQVEGERDRWG